MENRGEIIALSEAIVFTHGYQTANPNAIKAYAVSKDKLLAILEQENCEGMRIYNGIDADTARTNLVLVGIDKEGEDMTQGVIVENLSACPPHCPPKSILIKK